MTRRVLAHLVPVAAILLAAEEPAAKPTLEQQKAELQERIEDLQDEIPKQLRTKLAIISMKIATGYCSPYRVAEFEKQLESLNSKEQAKFADELKSVREHPLWPSLAKLPEAGSQ